MSKRIFAALAILLFSSVAALQAQNLFVMPGANQSGNLVQVFAASPLSSINSFQAGAGTFLVLSLPDGSKYYAISTSLSQSVTKIDSTFQVPQDIAAFSQAPTAAVLTPDGSRLAVAAGTLHIFDTTTDKEIVPGGINVGTGINVSDVAVSLDGATLFTLGTAANTSTINAIDVASHVVTGTMGFNGVATSISVGPNGILYITLPNEVLDVNPATFKPYAPTPISVTGLPGRPAFTSDGQYALFPNETPATGTALMLVSLANRAIVSTTATLQLAFDSLLVTGTNSFIGYASSTQTAYQISIASNGSLAVAPYTVSNANGPTALAVSNEVPVNGIPYVSSLYAVATGTNPSTPGSQFVDQLNPQSGQAKNVATLPSGVTANALSFTRTAMTNEQPTILLQYGGGLTLPPSTMSPPVVVRVLDNNGLPISGVPVFFSTNGPGANVSSPTVTTSSTGYAVTYLTTGATAGPLQVNATAGSKSVSFTFTVSNPSTTPGQTLTFVSGQGQILPENNNTATGLTGTHLAVQVSDADGNPLPNTTVTFLITSGTATLISGGLGGTSQTVQTDSKGTAFVDILVPQVTGNDAIRGFGQVQVVASAPGTNTLTFTVTYVPQSQPAIIQQQAPQAGSGITGQVGQTIPGALVYQITSSKAYPIPGVGITLNTQFVDPSLYPSAKCNDPSGNGVVSDGNGILTCDLVLGPRIGTASLSANIGYSVNLNPFPLVIKPGPPSTINLLQGNNQSGQPGVKLATPLVVQVTDAGGNILPGASVVWTVASGSATLSQVISVTDVNGKASALATLGNAAGPVQVTVTSANATATFNLSVVVPSSGITKVSGDAQSAVINMAFASPLVVQVAGTDGKPVAGAIVNFQVTSGSATVNTASGMSDANGQASTTVTAGATAGPVVVTATTASFSVTFNLSVRLPGATNLAIVNGASFESGTGISPGGIAVISGLGIVPNVQGLVTANNIVGPLPTSLEGVSVTFNGVAAPIYYVMHSDASDQVAVQVPFETLPAGTTAATNVQVVVTASSGSPATISVPVKPFAPGIFTTTTAGGTVLPVAQRPDGSYVSPTNPAQLGENITLYVTGLGQTTPAASTGVAGIEDQRVVTPLIIGLNNGGVPLISAKYVQGLNGVYAVTFQVPSETATGSAPLAVVAYDSSGNFYYSQGISIPVQ